ncbi:helix-turn-helix transcriptional regulator [Flavobacterium agricola]|uniref:Helix-turn-helix transcriptional regulator n=1 Tax=Flavobacterium agricola TaxID=2870839 RepID=A0ABY6M2Z2_9FLAO|nr:helix-turn-helix transcriptional regulator [Flavobacterium agricola]UYW02202.1 helix-turn-helix transcriptional regulator [Flavobacterium agricola]
MLNLDEFTKRLEQLFNFYELTPSTFADKIGVQRSSVSHLLSGRNKPSLDFVLKVQDSFSDLDLNWLLHGNGNMLTSAFASTPFLTESTFTNQLSDHESENEKKRGSRCSSKK